MQLHKNVGWEGGCSDGGKHRHWEGDCQGAGHEGGQGYHGVQVGVKIPFFAC